MFMEANFFFPGMFFFRHPRKSCSVFYILETKKFFWKDQKRVFFLFRMEGVMVEEFFAYIFGNYIKFGYKNPSILAPYNLVDVAT